MFWIQIRGYMAGVVAFVTCPCHLVIVWPILLTLTAGTVFGAWLAANLLTIGAMMTVMFVIGLLLAFKWLAGEPISACEPDNLQQQKGRLQNERL